MEPPPVDTDVIQDYNDMLREVVNCQSVVRSGNDDLAEIRKLI